ncbi:MAG: P-loop NTPase fold protein [Pseudomonadota bacterium]
MKTTEYDYTFNLLHEQVSSSDLFPDQTHERISNTIYRLIDGADKAITIGVEGSWGSGKSTVIELLKGKINKDKNSKTLFFLFDAWAHEGDPLRRIFLESLIKEIDPKGADSYLNKLLLEIGGRSKTVKVTTSRKASSLGKKLFASAFMVPIGSALLSINKFEGLVWSLPKFGFSEVIFSLGFILSSFPILFLVWWWMCGEEDEKTGKVRWDFMESDSTEDYTQDITEDGERTSIEFEKYFKDIFEYVLGNEKTKIYDRVIIVVDNLDRIDTQHAATIWSTLQTFFQHRNIQNGNKAEWVKNLWFLVPYDREGLSRIWDSKFQNDNDISVLESLASDNKKRQQNKITSDISKSFLSKNFQVVAEVPTPVMSAWHEYSVKCVNEALNKWPENERKEVISTFQRYGSRLDISPTPREIQNFVNQIGLLGMTWGGETSAEALALYALLRLSRTENELRGVLLQAGLPDGYSTDADSDEIKKELAGLMFGVPKDKGIQLLLGPVIHDAMRNGDGEILEKLLDEQGEAFWIAWRAIRDVIAVSSSHTQEYILSATIAMHDGLAAVKQRIKPDIVALEKVWRITSEKWEFKQLDYAHTIPLMAELVENKENFVSWCFTVVKAKLSGLVKQVEKKEVEIDDLKQISSLASFLADNDKPLNRLTYTALTQEGWIYWLNTLGDEGVELPTVLPDKGVINSLATSLLPNPTTVSDEIIDILLSTLKLHPRSSEWKLVAETIILWASNPSRSLESSLAYELMMSIHSQCMGSVSKIIDGCVEGADFWVRASAEEINKIENLPILVASVLGSRMQENSSVSAAVKDYWKNDSSEISNIDALAKFNQLSLVWEMARDKLNKLAITIIRNNLKSKELFSNSNVFLMLDDFRWIQSSDKQIIYILCENSDLKKVAEELESDPLKYAYNLYLLLSYGNKEAKDFAKSIVVSLRSEKWEASLKDNSYLLNCVLDDNVVLDHKYKDAFEKYFNDVMDTGIADDWLWENFEALLSKTIDTDILKKNLTKKYFSTDIDNLSDDSFLSILGHLFTDINEVTSHDVMSRACVWLDTNKWDRLLWLVGSGYTTDVKALEVLESRIKEKVIEIGEGDKSILDGISNLFNIEIDHGNKEE